MYSIWRDRCVSGMLEFAGGAVGATKHFVGAENPETGYRLFNLVMLEHDN